MGKSHKMVQNLKWEDATFEGLILKLIHIEAITTAGVGHISKYTKSSASESFQGRH